MAGIVAFAVFFILGYLLYSYDVRRPRLHGEHRPGSAADAVAGDDAHHLVAILLMNPVLQHPNSPLAFWLSMVPFFAPILMLVRVLIEQPPMWQIVLCIAMMLATT